MKKRMASILAFLLALTMLVGCTDTAVKEEEPVEHIPFSEMVYVRPVPDEMDVLMEELQALLDGRASYAKVEAKLDECFDYSFYTMYTLAEVHSYLDMTDEFYADEYEWISTEYALVQKAFDKLYYACAGSHLGKKLEKNYFWEGFCEEYSNPEDSIYSDEYVAMLQKESDLLARYREMIAAPTIVFQGEERDLTELLDELTGQDYNDAVQIYYQTYNEPLAEIYIELVNVRKAMAAKLEYDSYEQMQYEYYYERDYTPEEAAAYLEHIHDDVMPFYTGLMSRDPYKKVHYEKVDEERLYGILQTVSGEIGGDVTEAFDFMTEYGLYDIAKNPKKANMSFETYFPDYEEPFVFLGAAGDTGDVLSFAHEFGHFCDAYVNEGALSESIDLAEVFSQSMELLALSRLGDTMDDEAVANIARMKVLDMVSMYVQQAAFAEFETRVYALEPEELTADAINKIMLEESRRFGFCIKDYEWAFSLSWIDITHFFEAPFYVISYPVSNDLAMQIYAMELQEEGSGRDHYLSVLRHDYTGIMDLVEDGGFASPFSEGRTADVVEIMRAMFNKK